MRELSEYLRIKVVRKVIDDGTSKREHVRFFGIGGIGDEHNDTKGKKSANRYGYVVSRDAPKRTARGAGSSPWDLKITIFYVFLLLNYVIFVFATGVLKFVLCERIEEA